MTLRQLPEAKTFQRPQNFQWDAPSDVLAKWAETPLAAADDGVDNTISVMDVIGEDFWTGGGVTSKRISAALRSMNGKDVVVRINSPGGDMFEGISIYNLLRSYQAKVTVEVLGWAASAASIIAMAGDEIRMGLGSFMMVHNAWGMVVGNRHDMRDAAALFDTFDSAITDIYAARTGLKRDEITKLMDAETFMGASDAVKNKFADALDEKIATQSGSKNTSDRHVLARRQAEAALARAGYSRDRRSELLLELGAAAPRDASGSLAPRDASQFETAARQFLEALRK